MLKKVAAFLVLATAPVHADSTIPAAAMTKQVPVKGWTLLPGPGNEHLSGTSPSMDFGSRADKLLDEVVTPMRRALPAGWTIDESGPGDDPRVEAHSGRTGLSIDVSVVYEGTLSDYDVFVGFRAPRR